MAPEKAPAFQFYPKDFLADARVVGMTLEERGAYITLLCLCWTETTLPVNEADLARLLKCSPKTLRRIWPALGPCFVQADDGYRHKRLEKEREKQAAHRQVQKQRADKRWHQSGNATALPRQSPTDALPSPISHLRSASAEQKSEERRAPAYQTTPIIGRNPHKDHVFCDSELSYCVPAGVHEKLSNLLAPKHAGDREAAKEALREWYPTVTAKLVAGFIMGDAFKFWQGRFDAAFATPDPKPSTRQRLTEDPASMVAGVREILKRQGAL